MSVIEGKEDIIKQLQKEVLLMQGFKSQVDGNIKIKLGPIDTAFPNGIFPLAAVHEFLNESICDKAATAGFISYLLSGLMVNDGVCIWVSQRQAIFPSALKAFNINPDKIIFIHVKNDKEILWVIEEALKCEGLAAVIGEIKELSFTESRRLQLAVEKTKITSFIIRNSPRTINVTACVSRWRISSLPSLSLNNLPGIGFPCWNIELLKIRNGKPGTWMVEWAYGKLRTVPGLIELNEPQRNVV